MNETKSIKEQVSIALCNLLKEDIKEKCEASFAQFVRCAWSHWKPSDDVIWSWAQEYMCSTLQAEIERIGNREKRIHRYIVCNVPPGSSKSTIFSRMANAWAWIHFPWIRFITSSHSAGLSAGFSGDTLNIITSDWYQENWGDRFTLLRNRRSSKNFANREGGERSIASTGKSPVGKHCHIFNHDDPIDPEGSEYETQLRNVNRYCTRTADQRLLNNGSIWIVMQRLHENDPTGYLLEKQRNRVKWICIPAEITARVKPEPPELEKFYKDGMFFPEYDNFSREELDAKKENPSLYASQYQQRPSPEEGGMFKRQNWRFWVPAGTFLPPVTVEIGNEVFTCENVDLPASFDTIVDSWDFTFKDKDKNDFVSGHVLTQKAANYFVIDRDHQKRDYLGSKLAVIKNRDKWPLISTTYYEDKANGPAIGSELKPLLPGMQPVAADGNEGPYTRAVMVSATQKTGNLILPHPLVHAWANDIVESFAAYPNGKNDDDVASICQGVRMMRSSKPVIPGFEAKRQSYKVQWKELDRDSRLYISQHVSTDLQTSIIMALWSTKTGRLLIFDEFTVSTTLPEYIKPMLELKITRLSGGAITNLSRFEWYGNAFMFSRTGKKTTVFRSTLILDGISEAYNRGGVNLQDNIMYEESGSVMLMQRMIIAGALLFDERAAETIRQVSAWQYEGKEPAPGHGCARAVCNIISVLYKAGKSTQKPKELKHYSDKRQQVYNEYDQHGSEEDIDRRVRALTSGGNRTNTQISKIDPSDQWMV